MLRLLLPLLVAALVRNLTLVSGGPAVDIQPAWSASGKHISFLRVIGGTREVYRMDADGTDFVLLSDIEVISDESGAIWSPDGSQIAFVQAEQNFFQPPDEPDMILYVMNAGGTEQKKIVSMPGLSDLAWSPDGSRIAFAGNGAIYVVGADGSNLRKLTGDESYSLPVWSPDSRQIAYYDSSLVAIRIMDVESGDDRILEHSSQIGIGFSSFVWSPDGEKIAFVYNVVTSSDPPIYEIGVVDVDDGDLTQVTNHPAEEYDIKWSPDGQKFTFTRSQDVHVINIDGSGHHVLIPGFGTERVPVWSPDSSRIAFISNAAGPDEVYVIDAAGGDPERLTTNSVSEGSVAWSPAGNHLLINGFFDSYRELRLTGAKGGNSVNVLPNTYIVDATWSPASEQVAFIAGDSANPFRLHRVDANGSNLTSLAPDLNVYEYAWSPDGQRFAVITPADTSGLNPLFDLYVVDHEGQPAKLITLLSEWDVPVPAWSPDGKRIAFSSGDIHVLNDDGTQHIYLTNTTAIEYAPQWSPDGTMLAYVGASNELYVVNPDGGEPVQLTDDGAIDNSIFEWAWSPDSSKIAYINEVVAGTDPLDAFESSLNIVNVDGSGHKQIGDDIIGLSWSPDGRYLLIHDTQNGLEVYDVAGDRRTPLGVHSFLRWSWSPDARSILISALGDIYTLEMDELP